MNVANILKRIKNFICKKKTHVKIEPENVLHRPKRKMRQNN
jgi:hypothetical protein